MALLAHMIKEPSASERVGHSCTENRTQMPILLQDAPLGLILPQTASPDTLVNKTGLFLTENYLKKKKSIFYTLLQYH